jgi:hypothetical protein
MYMTSAAPASKKDDYESERKQLAREQKVCDKLLAGAGHCIICGATDPIVLEEHHIAGRKHSDLMVTLCANCHQKLSRRQQSYPISWLEAGASPLACIAYTLRGLADILRAISDILLEREGRQRGTGS